MNKYRKVLIGTLFFFLAMFIIVFVRDLKMEGRIRLFDRLVTYEMPEYWKPSEQDVKDDEVKKKTPITERKPDMLLNTTSHSISRQQLGRHSWTLLHMISGQMPDEIDEQLRNKINVFLNLFGQFYPCKLCGTHFLAHTKNFQFQGKTKKDFMVYMCDLHNIVNKALSKPIYSCQKIEEEWSACGCSSQNS